MAIGGGGGGGKSRAVRAGRAVVEAFLDDAGFKAQVAKLQKRVLGIGKGILGAGGAIAGLGAAVAAPIAAAFHEAVQEFDEFQKLSDRTGTTTEALSKLGYAAKQSDASISDVSAAAKVLQKNIGGAHQGVEASLKAFSQLGLSVEDLEGKGLDEQFLIIADALDNLADPADRTRAAIKLLGNGGRALLPLFKGGADSLRELFEEAEATGSIIEGDKAKQAVRIGDAISKAWTAVKNTFREVGVAFFGSVDQIEGFANRIVEVSKAVRNFIKENKSLVMGVAAGAAGLIAAGTAIAAVGSAIIGVGLAIGAIGTIVSTLIAALPVLVGIGVVIAGAWLQAKVLPEQAQQSWQMFIQFIQDATAGLLDTLMQTFGNVKTALQMGDLKLAWEVLMLGLEGAWRKFMNNLEKVWEKTKLALKLGYVDLMADAKRASGVFSEEAIQEEQARARNALIAETAKRIKQLERDSLHVDRVLRGVTQRVEQAKRIHDNTKVFQALMDSIHAGTNERVIGPGEAGFRKAGLSAAASAQTFSGRMLQQALGLGGGVKESDETKELKKANGFLEDIADGVEDLELNFS